MSVYIVAAVTRSLEKSVLIAPDVPAAAADPRMPWATATAPERA